MKLLLDTHAFLWWCTDDPKLSLTARNAIADEANEILVSATKYRLGKLQQASQAVSRFNELVAADGFTHLPITHVHALRAGSFDVDHRDPFDRMLAAQSEIERVPLVTLDPAFAMFGIRTYW